MICLRRDCWILTVLMMSTVSHAFVLDSSASSNILASASFRHQQPTTRQPEQYRCKRSYHQTRWVSALSTSSDGTPASVDKVDVPSSLQDLQVKIQKQCDEIGNVDNAINILYSWMNDKYYDNDNKDAPMIVKSCCKIILQTLIELEETAEKLDTVDLEDKIPPYLQADKLLTTMISWGEEINADLLPTADIFELVIKVWISATDIVGASGKCRYYVKKLWSLHKEQSSETNVDEQRLKLFVPTKQCYEDAIRACSLKDRSVKVAYLADELLNEMESLCTDYPQITPDRYTINKVMTAWMKSENRSKRPGTRCEFLLEKMMEKAKERPTMEPITSTFNIVINAIARDRHYNAGVRAEELLYKMEELSANGGLCAPDEISFNAVMNCWAESNNREAALRATAILDHMEKRYDAGLTEIHPDHVTFNTVLKSWSRSKNWEAIAHAEKVFDKYKKAIVEKKWDIYPSALTFNTMIRCYVQNKSPRATDEALKLFEEMRTNSGKPGWELCFVDIYTYCFLIEAFANQGTFEASQQAISLMEEVEKKYEETEDPKYQPNIQLYTNALKAIARSRKEPERSQKIVDRLEASYLEGKIQWQSRPDVWLYNSLINAYGWSDVKGKSKKCFNVLQHMIDLYESKKILDAKPDLVTFNSVLNACVFEVPSAECSHEEVMKIAVDTFELLTAKDDASKERGRFGKPDHHTYAQMLMVVTNHVPEEDEKRISLAEALFFKCAEDGLVTERTIVKLEAALPKANFEKILGSALITDKDRLDGQELRFDMTLVPQKWTANVEEDPRRRGKTTRSRRRENSFQVTKRSILNRSS